MLKVYENNAARPVVETEKLPLDQILIQALTLDGYIGVFEHEYTQSQPIRFDIAVDIAPLSGDLEHDAQNIVRYDYIVDDIRAVLKEGHIDLVETLAEQVAEVCLAYVRAKKVAVTITKPAAFTEAEAVGVRITRAK